MTTQCRRGRPRRALSLAVGGAMLLLAACGGGEDPTPAEDRSAAAAPAYRDYHGVELALPLPRPNFVLTDTRGEPFDFRAETSGRVTLLMFGYTACPDVCPLHLSAIRRGLERLEPELRDQVDVVFVGTDVERDTPERVREWLDHFGADFIGLSGDTEAVELAQRRSNVEPARRVESPDGSYVMEHVAWILLYTQDDIAHIRYPLGVQPEQWADDLQILVTEGWQ